MNNRTKKDRFLIDKKQLIDDVYYEIVTSNDPDIKIPYKRNVIKLSPKSVKKIYRIIENVVMYYLKTMDLVDDNEMMEIRPFDGVVLQRWDEPEETKTNPFTGETYTRTARKRFHAYISRYWHRTNSIIDLPNSDFEIVRKSARNKTAKKREKEYTRDAR